MFRRFQMWRLRRRLGRSPYRMDSGVIRGSYRPNLDTYLQGSRFWNSGAHRFRRRRRGRRRLLQFVALIALITAIWVVYESVGALGLFL